MTKTWDIKDDTIFNISESHMCENAVKGVCYEINSLKECISLTDRLKSIAGYYINDKKLCIPLSNKLFEYINPHYLQVPRENSTSFILNSGTFPLNEANSVFYGDIFHIKARDKYVTTKVDSKSGIGIMRLSSEKNNIMILSNTLVSDYTKRKVLSGDIVWLGVPETSLKAVRDNDTGYMVWKPFVGDIIGNRDTITIIAVNKKKGEPIVYGDTIKLIYSGNFHITFENLCDCLISTNDIDKQTEFTLEPNITVFYCNKKCLSIPLNITEKDNEKAYYKKNIVYRDNNCLFICNNTSKSNNINFYISILLLVFILIIVYDIVRRK